MAFFPRGFPNGEFAPLFRLLDDYASHSATREGPVGSSSTTSVRSFNPRFDIREVKDAYELHGELPGIAQKDISIEFTDAQTLQISGRTERTYEAGTKPTAAIEEDKSSHQATVEDEPESEPSTKEAADTQLTPASSEDTIAKANESSARYWVSERSIGQFSRSFAFPGRVDHEGVKASLKDGVLSITVPKAKAPATRKITIE
jgi:HSP20 family protein